MYKQIPIPGLEPPPEPAKKPKAGTWDRIASLETRVLRLELELILLRIQMEGNRDRA